MILRLLLFSFTIIINISFPQDQLSVTFRYVETPEDNFVRVFVPGEMNNWGPNSSGFISPSAVSLMALDPGNRLICEKLFPKYWSAVSIQDTLSL